MVSISGVRPPAGGVFPERLSGLPGQATSSAPAPVLREPRLMLDVGYAGTPPALVVDLVTVRSHELVARLFGPRDAKRHRPPIRILA